MMISLNTVARIAKLVALLGFFLPWVLVSCSGNEIAHGSGFDMMTGHLQPNPQLVQNDQSATADKTSPEIFTILAFALIVVGLLGSFALRARAASALMVATAVLAIAASFYSFEHMHEALIHAANRSAGRANHGEADAFAPQVGSAVAGVIRIEKQDGFWVTVGALAAAACLALVALALPAPTPPPIQPRMD
ncbi:MAG TPA: hypothetical protein VG943_05725 [Caulobacterales bacterium]|nr:hypothetical protein [Caulobacterales bacterium]